MVRTLSSQDSIGPFLTVAIVLIVFTRELLLECIGILAEHRGAKLAEAMDDKYFKRVVFSSESTPFEWLSSFADLHDLIGEK